MKKCLHFVVFLVLSLFATSVSAQNLGYVLEEDFEKGIPTTWKQEKVFGDFSWTVESGDLKYPNGTAKGTKSVFDLNSPDSLCVGNRVTFCASHPFLEWPGHRDSCEMEGYKKSQAEDVCRQSIYI